MMSNQPIVFLPGTLCDERVWHEQTSFFPGSICINLRSQETIDKMVSTIAMITIDKFILVGYSMGGYVAQEFALRYPERVTALVLIGSSIIGYPPSERQLVLQSLNMIKQSKFTGITDRRLKDFLHPKSYDDVEMKQLIHDMAGPDAKEVYLRQLTATLDRRDLTEEIKNLHCLVWYLAGADDKIISLSSIERSQQATPHSKLFTIKDCGHFIPLEQPDKVNQILLTLLTQVMHSSRMKI